jgi:hypothetical protein
MKSKMPEVIALILLIASLLVPPWNVLTGLPDTGPIYITKWSLIFEGGGQIDVVLLLVELLAIAGIYFLLKLILK